MSATETSPAIDERPRFSGEWVTKRLGQMGNCLRGVGYDPESDLAPHDTDRTYRLLRSTNVQGGRLALADLQFVDQTRVARAQQLQENDLVFCAANGSRALVGKSARFDVRDGHRYTFGAFMGAFRASPDNASSEFAGHLFQSDAFFRCVDLVLSGSAINNLSPSEVEAFSFEFPPLPEQRAIGAALSDVDDLLQSLDRLIAKKRDVKQGAMQQLLTGTTRLLGFEGAWETKRLGEVADIVGGGTPSTAQPAYWGGRVLWCTPTDLTANRRKYQTGTERTISALGLQSSAARLLPKGALLLCTRATIGEVRIADVPIATNQGFQSLVCRDDFESEFVYYKLLTLRDDLVSLGVGSTFLEVSRKSVAAIRTALPALPEQRAIAAVLSDMDAEIDALEARRDKVAAIKQGMMQELLTGRTRLPIPEEAIDA